MKKKDELEVTIGSGNAFLDMGHQNPEEALAKSNLAHQISKVIKSRKLTQKQTAEILGISQPNVSDIVRGNLQKYSIDRLMRFLRVLGKDIEIRVKKSKYISRPRLEVVGEEVSSSSKKPRKRIRKKTSI